MKVQPAKKSKKTIDRVMVESTFRHGNEIRVAYTNTNHRVNAVGLDYLRRSARVNKFHHFTNIRQRIRMDIRETILD